MQKRTAQNGLMVGQENEATGCSRTVIKNYCLKNRYAVSFKTLKSKIRIAEQITDNVRNTIAAN